MSPAMCRPAARPTPPLPLSGPSKMHRSLYMARTVCLSMSSARGALRVAKVHGVRFPARHHLRVGQKARRAKDRKATEHDRNQHSHTQSRFAGGKRRVFFLKSKCACIILYAFFCTDAHVSSRNGCAPPRPVAASSAAVSKGWLVSSRSWATGSQAAISSSKVSTTSGASAADGKQRRSAMAYKSLRPHAAPCQCRSCARHTTKTGDRRAKHAFKKKVEATYKSKCSKVPAKPASVAHVSKALAFFFARTVSKLS